MCLCCLALLARWWNNATLCISAVDWWSPWWPVYVDSHNLSSKEPFHISYSQNLLCRCRTLKDFLFIPSPLLLPQVAIKKNTVSCLDVIFKVFHQLLKSSLFFCASILVWCTEHCEFLCLPLLQTVDCLSGFHLMFKLLFEFLPGVHCVFLGHQGSWSWS